MATQRRVPIDSLTEKERELQPKDGPSDIKPAVPNDVLYKLLGFTFAMIILPIGSYFVTMHTIFKGHSSYAGGFAALIANVVLIGYVIVAMKEDQSDAIAEMAAKKGKKAE